MFSYGRNNIIGYCLTSSSKQEVRVGGLFSPTSTVITASGNGLDSNVNMAIADSQGNSISVNCHSLGEFAIAIDGALIDQEKVCQEILESNMVMLSKSSEELMAYLLAKETTDKCLLTSIIKVLNKYQGGYSLIIMSKERIYAARDCYGIKPLVIGRVEDSHEVIQYDFDNDQPEIKNKAPNVIASTSVILENIGAKYIRQVLPGEVVELTTNGVKSLKICYRKYGDASAMCAMEYVIMEPPSSFLEEQRVQNVRYRLGQALANECKTPSDYVITLPNISLSYLLGYARESGTLIMEAFYYSHSITEPKQLFLYNENVADKVITLVIDSTMNSDLTAALYLLKTSSAKKVHLRVCSPMIVRSCPFGIELVTQCNHLKDVESVTYLSVASLSKTIRKNIPDNEVRNVGHCLSCFGKGQCLGNF